MKTQLTVKTAFSTKLSEFGWREVEIFTSGFGYIVEHLWRTATFYGMPNVKRDGTKRNSDFKRQTGDE